MVQKNKSNVNPKAKRCLREESTPATALQRVFEEALAPRAPGVASVPDDAATPTSSTCRNNREQPHKLKPQADWAERVITVLGVLHIKYSI